MKREVPEEVIAEVIDDAVGTQEEDVDITSSSNSHKTTTAAAVVTTLPLLQWRIGGEGIEVEDEDVEGGAGGLIQVMMLHITTPEGNMSSRPARPTQRALHGGSEP